MVCKWGGSLGLFPVGQVVYVHLWNQAVERGCRAAEFTVCTGDQVARQHVAEQDQRSGGRVVMGTQLRVAIAVRAEVDTQNAFVECSIAVWHIQQRGLANASVKAFDRCTWLVIGPRGVAWCDTDRVPFQ